jgi:ADP-heptose:LPS heptosyltransferase
LLERTDTFVAIDSVVTHLSLHSNKKGIVLWGSSNPKTHGHEHNINLEAIRHCGQPPCIDKGSFYVPDDLNQRCCLMPENARKDVWPLLDEVVHEINSIL